MLKISLRAFLTLMPFLIIKSTINPPVGPTKALTRYGIDAMNPVLRKMRFEMIQHDPLLSTSCRHNFKWVDPNFLTRTILSFTNLSDIKMQYFYEIFWDANKNGVKSPVCREVGNDYGPDRNRCNDRLPWYRSSLERKTFEWYSLVFRVVS